MLKRIYSFGLGFALCVLACSSQVQASISWDFNLSGASGGAVANITNVNEAQFLASSTLGFRDRDGSGGISTGDTFQDYTVLRLSNFTDATSSNVTPATYGTGPGRT